jgi:hypothetical protein
MGAASYDDLVRHVGHEIVVTDYAGLNVAVECTTCNEVLLDYDSIQVHEPPSPWEDDLVQFARLLCEINANWTVPDALWKDLRRSMDLREQEVLDLFERAHGVWHAAKLKNCPIGAPEVHPDGEEEVRGSESS